MCHNLQEANLATAKNAGNQKQGIKDQDAATKQKQLTKEFYFDWSRHCTFILSGGTLDILAKLVKYGIYQIWAMQHNQFYRTDN